MVKPTNATLNAILASRQFFIADLITFTLQDGTALTYTSGQTNITFNGTTYLCGGQTGPYFDRKDNKAKAVWNIGVGTDTLVIDILPGPSGSTINLVEGHSWFDAVRLGLFDGADFEIDRAYMAVASIPSMVFNSATVCPQVTLSNNNLTATDLTTPSSLNYYAPISVSISSASKIYFEIVIGANYSTGINNAIGVGVTDPSFAGTCGSGSYIGVDTHSLGVYGDPVVGGYYFNSVLSTETTSTFSSSGSNVGIAIDTVNKKMWMRVNGGNWNNSVTENPATNTGGQDMSSLTSFPLTPTVVFRNGGGGSANGQFSSGSWSFAAPSGFTSLGGAAATGGYGNVSPGCAPVLFKGRVAEIEADRAIITMSINDYRELLNQQMPRWLYSASCQNSLYDASCTLISTNFQSTGTVGAGSSFSFIINTTLAQASGYFDLGKIKFTSGNNTGLIFPISSWSSSLQTITLAAQTPFIPVVSDQFTIFPGCDLSTSTSGCGKFANLANFRGMPYIPDPGQAL